MATKLFNKGDDIAAASSLTVTASEGEALEISDIYATTEFAGATLDVAVVPAGESLGPQHYIVLNKAMIQDDTIVFGRGIRLSPGDYIKFEVTGATVVVRVFGRVERA